MPGTADSNQGRLPTYKESVARNPPTTESRRDRQNSPPEYDVDFDETKQHEEWVERKIMSHALTHCAKTLGHYLETQAQILPDPILRIRGWHKRRFVSDGFSQYGTHVDFDFTISLQDQLAHRANMSIIANSMKTYRGTRNRADGLEGDVETARPAPSLEQCCRDFCAYRSGPKSFTFLRMVVKLEQAMSIESIKKILRDVKYTGNIDVTVEVEEHETTLLSDHALARIRSSSFWWFLCVVCQLWIVYWLLSKHWDVLTIEWPTKSSQFLTGDQESGDGATAWSEKWRCAIARAALENMRGKLASAETSPGGAAWKALGDFDEVRDWGHGD